MNNNLLLVTSLLAQTISDVSVVKSSITDIENRMKTINSTMTSVEISLASTMNNVSV